MKHRIAVTVCVLCLAPVMWTAAETVTIANQRVRLTISPRGDLVSLLDRASGRECLAPREESPFAFATVDGRNRRVVEVKAPDEGRLSLSFEGVDTRVEYGVDTTADWIRFEVRAIEGTRPERLVLFRLRPSIEGLVGRRLCIAYDDHTAVNLMAGNEQVQCRASSSAPPVLSAQSQDAPGPRLEGAAAALIVCPTAEFKAIALEASHAFGLLTNETADGAPIKDTDLVRGSYFFISFGEADVDRVIALCRDTGIRQVLLNSGAWCARVGHYEINRRNFPEGVPSLQRTVERLHREGILVGMHCFASKISKRDAYVSPVPDPRFWHKFEAALAEDISAEHTDIRVTESLAHWAGSPKTASQYWEGGVEKHREVVIGKEIVQYERVGPEGVWDTFQGCNRGAWGTQAASHAAHTPALHYGVDGCINGYIIDQETSLLTEVHQRLGHIFNTCGFDMVYFDGGEDVDRRRFSYYATNFQASAMRHFERRPIIHMGTVMTHRLWHSFARSSTVDTYLNTLSGAIVGGREPESWPTVRDHIERSVNYMLSVRGDMMPGELGWFGIWGRRQFHGQDVDGLQLDEIEYLLCRSLAYDAPISLQTSFASLEAHPLTPEILRIVRKYEALRLSGSVDAAVLATLKKPGTDHVLIQRSGRPRFVAVKPLEAVGGDGEVRGTVGAFEHGALATLWHASRWGTVTLDLPTAAVRAEDLEGNDLAVTEHEGKAQLSVDHRRTTVICPDLAPEDLARKLAEATVWTNPPDVLVVRAADATKLVGAVALGASVGVIEPEAHGDVLVGTAASNYTEGNAWYAEYTVTIPHDGLWTVWSRQRYPSGTDQSFAFVPEGDPLTFQGNQVLGNCGVNEKQWHWAGRGAGSTTVPPGAHLTLRLDKGPFTFRIHPRECGADPKTNPRLDLIMLVDERSVQPADHVARAALTRQADVDNKE